MSFEDGIQLANGELGLQEISERFHRTQLIDQHVCLFEVALDGTRLRSEPFLWEPAVTLEVVVDLFRILEVVRNSEVLRCDREADKECRTRIGVSLNLRMTQRHHLDGSFDGGVVPLQCILLHFHLVEGFLDEIIRNGFSIRFLV